MRSPQLNPIGLGTNTINSNRERSVSHLLNRRQLLTSGDRPFISDPLVVTYPPGNRVITNATLDPFVNPIESSSHRLLLPLHNVFIPNSTRTSL
ncbi:hypothetical protein PGT21_024528 [Puccinia graminis f. sp. tritici]|uniref:Uncharacterized protein n=1 Tax=Puccinia graminis f. sp. tritici TaxID=56615 RepID=A0A5B0R1G7_PUCGR|nr:hypothetical protein PGT21_024528 [Puccinia graminis f. sp. tritici]